MLRKCNDKAFTDKAYKNDQSESADKLYWDTDIMQRIICVKQLKIETAMLSF